MWKSVFVFVVFHPRVLFAQQCSLKRNEEIEYVLRFFHQKNIDVCTVNPTSLREPFVQELRAGLRTSRVQSLSVTSCDYMDLKLHLRALISKRELPSADRRRFTYRLVDSLFDELTCGMNKQLSETFMNADYHVLESWFQFSPTTADRHMGFNCEVQAARRDLAQYRRILEDPDELELLEALIIYGLRNQVDLTITKREFMKRVFLTTQGYEWWPQNRFYPKMVECMSRKFAFYAQDLSEIKPDTEVEFRWPVRRSLVVFG